MSYPEFVESADEAVDFMFEVMSIAVRLFLCLCALYHHHECTERAIIGRADSRLQ